MNCLEGLSLYRFNCRISVAVSGAKIGSMESVADEDGLLWCAREILAFG